MNESFLKYHKTLRIIISLIVSLFIVLHGRWSQFFEALTSYYFYLAVLVSFAISVLILWYIHFCNQLLDRWYPWCTIPSDSRIIRIIIRCLLQIGIGIIVPILIDLIAVGAYLHTIGQDIHTSGFLELDFPVIVFLISGVNCFYIGMTLFGGSASVPTDDKVSEESVMSVLYGGVEVQINIRTELLYCCRKGRNVTIYTTNGQSYHTYETLSSLIRLYSDAGLIQINRSTLINLAIISDYDEGLTKNTLQLYLKEEYERLPSCHNTHLFVITKAYISPFLTLYRPNV